MLRFSGYTIYIPAVGSFGPSAGRLCCGDGVWSDPAEPGGLWKKVVRPWRPAGHEYTFEKVFIMAAVIHG